MKDKAGEIIYIGKAKSLKKRLANYLGRDLSDKTAALMSFVADIECRVTQTEALALLLEASLIRKYKPKYNVALRDDKSFPLVKITGEEFPAVCITRKKENDASRYFGPYTNAGLLREALKIIRRYFPYRSCRKLPKRDCMYYRISLCPSCCTRKISRKDYAQNIESIVLILEGKTDELIKKLSREMHTRSAGLEYEEASRIRDRINALSVLGGNYSASNSHLELEELQKILKLKKLPERIEAFDISNISGQEACGSMVSFYQGSPDKDNYRRFRIKTVKGIDDYQMLAEVVRRRYRRVFEEKLPLPDLVLVDGGRAHLLTAQRELEKIGLKLALASIAKEQENVYTKGKVKPLRLNPQSAALNLIRKVRDEAHRFAVAYHHILRRKKIFGR